MVLLVSRDTCQMTPGGPWKGFSCNQIPLINVYGMNIVSVMNMIDESMKKYDVDTRSCMARTMCNQYAERTLQGEEEAVQRISRGLIEKIAQ